MRKCRNSSFVFAIQFLNNIRASFEANMADEDVNIGRMRRAPKRKFGICYIKNKVPYDI